MAMKFSKIEIESAASLPITDTDSRNTERVKTFPLNDAKASSAGADDLNITNKGKTQAQKMKRRSS